MNKPRHLQEILYRRSSLFYKKMSRECNRCKGEGILYNQDSVSFIDCPDCTVKFLSMQKYLEANIPPEYINLSMAELEATYDPKFFEKFKLVLEKAEEVLQKSGIVFHRGNDESFGVSTASIVIMKRLIDIGYECFYTEVNDLFNNMFTFGHSDETNVRRGDIMEYYTNVQCLIIDNFGMETGKQQFKDSYVYQKFCALLSTRAINGKFTIICTDLRKEEFSTTYNGLVLTGIRKYMFPIEVFSRKEKKKDKASVISQLIPQLEVKGYSETKPNEKVFSPLPKPERDYTPPEASESYKNKFKKKFKKDKNKESDGTLILSDI